MKWLVLWLALAAAAFAQEADRSAVAFDRWVRDTFFAGYKPAPGSPRWDIPAAANSQHGGLPVEVRLAREGEAIDLGDAPRQYEIDEPFLLIAGYWRPQGNQGRITRLIAVEVRPDLWSRLWAPITYNDLLKLDALIKDPAMPVDELRRLVLKTRNTPPFTQSIIQLNPKIGSDGHRALQCSLRFADVVKHLAPEAAVEPPAHPALWGIEFPGLVALPVRAGR